MDSPQQPWLRAFFASLLLVNLFGGLLPIGILDGARFLRLVLFSRHALLEAAFVLAGSLLVATFVFFVAGMMLMLYLPAAFRIPGFGYALMLCIYALALIPIPFVYRKARTRTLLRRTLGHLPARSDELTEDQRRGLFDCVRGLHPTVTDPDDLAAGMKALHEEAVTQPPGWLPTAGLVCLYVVGCVAGVLLVVALRAA
jgi:hypothetical protein